jgi:hypothetical protein
MSAVAPDQYWISLSGPVRTVAAAIHVLNHNNVPATLDAVKHRCSYTGVDVERVLRDLLAAGHIVMSPEGMFSIAYPPLLAAAAAHS